MTKRFHDWPTRLNDAIDARRKLKFEWGANDCCLFSADLVQAMTGTDLAAEWRGKYSSAIGAAKLLTPAGGLEGVMAKLCQAHGLRELPGVLWAQRGDVVLMDVPFSDADAGGPALGICIGSKVVGAGHEGAIFVKLSLCRKAWRVN